jgi:hypothetical protein
MANSDKPMTLEEISRFPHVPDGTPPPESSMTGTFRDAASGGEQRKALQISGPAPEVGSILAVIRSWCILLGLAILSACPTPPQGDTPTLQLGEKKYVRGYLQAQVPTREESGQGAALSIYIPNVTVTLSEMSSGTQVGEVQTDLSGRFNFPAQKSGDYKLCWKADGYKPDCTTKPIVVATRPVNVGRLIIKPLADFKNTVLVYGRVGQRDEQDGRTLEPVAGINAFVHIEARNAKGDSLYNTVVNNYGDYLLPKVPSNEAVVLVTARIEQESTTRHTYKEVMSRAPATRVDITLRNHIPRVLELVTRRAGRDVEYAQPGETIEVSISATDVDGDALTYQWQIGRGDGILSATSGPSVQWTLPATRGLYSTQVYVSDQHGGYVTKHKRIAVGVDRATFSGRVVSNLGTGLAGATVTLGGTADTTTTDANGYFTLDTALADRYTVNVHKSGFSTASRIYNRSGRGVQYILYAAHVQNFDPTQDIVAVDPNRQRTGCYVPVVERIDWKNFSNVQYARRQDASGRVVSVDQRPYQSPFPRSLIDQRQKGQCGPGVEVKIPANSLLDDAGNAPAGPVTVELSTVDLLAPDSMPGDLSANDGSYLESYGASSVTISAGGVQYRRLKPGTKALLRIPVSDAQLAAGGPIPSTIPKLVYNEKTGMWEAEGIFRLDPSGTFYEAEVTHFSSINTDIQKTGQSCVRFKSQDMPLPFHVDVLVPRPNAAPVQRTAQINANDEYNLIINLPNATDITLTAYDIVDNAVVPYGIFTVNTGGAQTGNPTAPNYSECQTKVIIFPVAEPAPGSDAFLHGLYSFFATKVKEADGTVNNPALLAELEQASIDYYNQIDPRGRRNSFEKFKQANGFVADGNTVIKSSYGPLDEVRAAYANAADLGFGRDMHAKRTLADDGQYDSAFYVTNYGSYESDDVVDHEQAVSNDPNNVVATVAMEWSRLEAEPATDFDYYDPDNAAPDPNDPNAALAYSGADRVIKFYVYNKDGDPVFAADLDGRGTRPVPQLCMVCHGGAYDTGFNTGTPTFSTPASVKLGSVMLPFDIHGYVFSGTVAADFTKTTQQLEFHELNKMVVDTQPGAVSEEMIDEMYSPTNPAGADTQIENFVVTGWNANDAHRDMYLNVIKPACRECHASRPLEDNGSGVTRDLRMQDVQQFLKTDANGGIALDASNQVCATRVMPHALATYNRFWHSYNPLSPLEGVMYQPARLKAFFDGVVTPVLGSANLGAGCVTTPTLDESVVEEPVTLEFLQTQIFDACSGCHVGSGNEDTYPYVNLDLQSGQTYASTVGVNAQESTTGAKRVQPDNAGVSYLYKKADGTVTSGECAPVPGASSCIAPMPPSGAGVDDATRDDIGEWIDHGAQP